MHFCSLFFFISSRCSGASPGPFFFVSPLRRPASQAAYVCRPMEATQFLLPAAKLGGEAGRGGREGGEAGRLRIASPHFKNKKFGFTSCEGRLLLRKGAERALSSSLDFKVGGDKTKRRARKRRRRVR